MRIVLLDIERERIRRRGFAQFVKYAWSHVDSSTLSWNWHLDILCKEAEGAAHRRTKRLCVNIPPGSSKSLLFSVLLPAYVWGFVRPDARFLYLSFKQELAERDAAKTRDLMLSRWYRELCPNVAIRKDSTGKGLYELESGGWRMSTGRSGDIIGRHPDYSIGDDLQKVPDFFTEGGRNAAIARDLWTEALPSRGRDKAELVMINVQQRIHLHDLSETLIRAGNYRVVGIPMEYMPDYPHLHEDDPRTEDGELMDPSRMGREQVDELKAIMPAAAYRAQYQQWPASKDAGLMRAEWFRRYPLESLPLSRCRLTASWDCTFKGLSGAESKRRQGIDYVVGTMWAEHDGGYYLVDLVRRKMDFDATEAAILAWTRKYPSCHEILIEDKANGSAIIGRLKRVHGGVRAVNPQGGKAARLEAVTPFFSSGRVFFPEQAPWLSDLEEELLGFPMLPHDDQVDSVSQALVHLTRHEMHQDYRSAYVKGFEALAKMM